MHFSPQLVEYCRSSDLISPDDKKQRFTEAYTIKMTSLLIERLEEENYKLGGMKGGAPTKPKRKKMLKKPSNSFIKFSACLRPTFVRVLSTHQSEGALSKLVRFHGVMFGFCVTSVSVVQHFSLGHDCCRWTEEVEKGQSFNQLLETTSTP